MSNAMRKACQDLMRYASKNSQKKVFFELGNKKSYSQYILNYFQANEGCQASLKAMVDNEKR